MLYYHNNFFFVVGNARSGTTYLINDDDVYRSIPNIDEINSILGNEKDGYIW